MSKKAKRKKNDGAEFELLSKKILEVLAINENCQITHNEKIETEFGERQIDVLIKSKIAGMNIITIVECKDHKRKIDIQVIDAFNSKMTDVGAHKGVLISSSGFSKHALKKARKLGISACTIHNFDEELKKISHKIPIILYVASVDVANFSARIYLNEGTTLNIADFNEISGIKLIDIIKEHISENIKFDKERLTRLVENSIIMGDAYIHIGSGEKIELGELKIKYEISITSHIGDVDVKHVTIFEKISESESNIFIDVNDSPIALSKTSKLLTEGEIQKRKYPFMLKIVQINENEVKTKIVTLEHEDSGKTFTIKDGDA